MAKVTITIQATNLKLDKYAEEQGYQSQIAIGQEVNGDTIVGPNPQTKQEYLAVFLKKVITDKLAKVRLEAIDREIRDQRLADKLAAEQIVIDDVTVTIA